MLPVRDHQAAEQADIEAMLRIAQSIFGRRRGLKRSPAKTKAVRENGKLGGRPPKVKAK